MFTISLNIELPNITFTLSRLRFGYDASFTAESFALTNTRIIENNLIPILHYLSVSLIMLIT